MSENTSRVGAVLGMVSDYVRRMATLLSDGQGLVEVLNRMVDSVGHNLCYTDFTEVGTLFEYSAWIESHKAYFDSVSQIRRKFLEKCNEFEALYDEGWKLDLTCLEKDKEEEILLALSFLKNEVMALSEKIDGGFQHYCNPSYRQLCERYDVEPHDFDE